MLCGGAVAKGPWIYPESLKAWDAGDPVEGAICPECRAAVEKAVGV
jgi:hypothetical protein